MTNLHQRSDRTHIITPQKKTSRWRRSARRYLRLRRRRLIQILWGWLDLITMAAATLASLQLLGLAPARQAMLIIAAAIVVRLGIFVRLGMYRAVLRYSGIHTLMVTSIGVASGTVLGVAIAFFLNVENTTSLGRAFLVLEALISLVACGGSRLAVRMVYERMKKGHGKRVLIYGAGDLGELTMRDLQRMGGYTPIGFIDDDQHKHGALIHGHLVHGGFKDLSRICEQKKPDLVLLAISNLPSEITRIVFQSCMEKNVRLKVVQGVTSSVSGSERLDLRDLALEDLLPRPSRSLNPIPVQEILVGRTVMVTGAGGSIGSELCRQIASYGVHRLILLDHSEFNLYLIHGEIAERWPGIAVFPVLCNLGCKQTLDHILSEFRPTIIFNAAAYKHVPLVEENPFLGIINNIGGFNNLLAAADAAGVERIVQVSTDKAVRPTNVMGATKRVCEILLQNYPTRSTKLCAVRFGNVLGSSGSVVPRFLEQIASGGPITITHPDITRYFMLIPEAVALVLQAGALADHGEIFILDMGAPVKIVNMAKQLIVMSGLEPEKDISIVYTGLRPGEKLYEELIIGDSECSTAVDGIMVAQPTPISYPRLAQQVERLLTACSSGVLPECILCLQSIVPEWTVSDSLKRKANLIEMKLSGLELEKTISSA